MKKIIGIGLMIFLSLACFAQDDRIDSILSDLLADYYDPLFKNNDFSGLNFIYSGIDFTSKAVYEGSDASGQAYSSRFTAFLYYYSPAGLYLGASGLWYDKILPVGSSQIITAGYYKPIGANQKLTFRTSYTRYFYPKSDTASKNFYRNNLASGLSLRNKWISGRFTVNFLFSDEYYINYSASLYSRVNIYRFGKTDRLYSVPEISVLAGTQTLLTFISDTSNSLSTLPPYQITERFGLLNMKLFLPLCLTLGNLEFETGILLMLPTKNNLPDFSIYDSYLTLSASYFFIL